MASRAWRAVVALAVALGLALGLGAPAVQAAGVSFGTPSASAVFGTGVTFMQPVTVGGPIQRVELLITFPTALGPLVHEIPVPSGSGALTLRGGWSETADGHLMPNTPVLARWRITPTSGAPVEGPSVSVLYADTRFAWKTISGTLVRLHWYQGSDAFAQQALAVGEKGVQQAADLLGVKETQPIDFFVYAAQAPFYDALGPGTRENVGGQADADIRTMFALIEPSAVGDSWVNVVIPHELTHLVFNTAVRNPYHFPPRWLNEGLAVYLSEGYTPSWRDAVQQAVSQESLLSLAGLTGQFPTSADGFYLAYGESVSAIDFFVRTYGKDHLVELVRSYAAGRTDDEAFTEAIGVNVAGFEAAWLASLGAAAPTRYGPQPAPAGPLPPGWGGPGGASSARPAGPAVAVSPPSGATGSPATVRSAAQGTAGDSSGGLLLLAIAVAGLAAGGGLGYVRRRRTQRAGRVDDADPPATIP
jgi:hypothetical protein